MPHFGACTWLILDCAGCWSGDEALQINGCVVCASRMSIFIVAAWQIHSELLNEVSRLMGTAVEWDENERSTTADHTEICRIVEKWNPGVIVKPRDQE